MNYFRMVDQKNLFLLFDLLHIDGALILYITGHDCHTQHLTNSFN